MLFCSFVDVGRGGFVFVFVCFVGIMVVVVVEFWRIRVVFMVFGLFLCVRSRFLPARFQFGLCKMGFLGVLVVV